MSFAITFKADDLGNQNKPFPTYNKSALDNIEYIFLKIYVVNLYKSGGLNEVENNVAKQESAHHEQFLLFPLRFQKKYAANASM